MTNTAPSVAKKQLYFLHSATGDLPILSDSCQYWAVTSGGETERSRYQSDTSQNTIPQHPPWRKLQQIKKKQ